MKSVKEPTIYPGVDAIRRVQMLMVLCSLLPADGKLREILQLALRVHEEPVLPHVTPMTDLHPHAVKYWLEALWGRDSASIGERELLVWQNISENMGTAIRELQGVEELLGVCLTAGKKS